MRHALITAIAISFLAVLQAHAVQKPVSTGDVHVEYQPAPPTLSVLANMADLVVVGTVTSRRNIVLNDLGHPYPRTEYLVTIDKTLKGTGAVTGSTVPIWRAGGDIDHGDKIRRSVEPGFAPFEIGEQYVLFLRWNGALTKYEVLFGPNGAFHISHGIVEAMGHSEASKRQHGKALGDVIAKLQPR